MLETDMHKTVGFVCPPNLSLSLSPFTFLYIEIRNKFNNINIYLFVSFLPASQKLRYDFIHIQSLFEHHACGFSNAFPKYRRQSCMRVCTESPGSPCQALRFVSLGESMASRAGTQRHFHTAWPEPRLCATAPVRLDHKQLAHASY
jgi:hypothetical protein